MSFWTEYGNWYKGNLHTHTTESDGDYSVADAIKAYKAKDYNFLAITDHDRLTDVAAYQEPEFCLIPSEEISCGVQTIDKALHMVALNIKETVSRVESAPTQEVINQIKAQGGEAIIAHPYWSGMDFRELLELDGFLGLEIFNSSCHFHINKAFSIAHWDALLQAGRNVYGFASDDAHHHFNAHRPDDTAFSFIMVKAKELTPQSLFAAIREGKFYSSNGPAIEKVEISGGKVYVKSSPARAITVNANGHLGEKFTAPEGETITEIECAFRGGEKYVRVEVWGGHDRFAWSNAVFL